MRGNEVGKQGLKGSGFRHTRSIYDNAYKKVSEHWVALSGRTETLRPHIPSNISRMEETTFAGKYGLAKNMLPSGRFVASISL